MDAFTLLATAFVLGEDRASFHPSQVLPLAGGYTAERGFGALTRLPGAMGSVRASGAYRLVGASWRGGGTARTVASGERLGAWQPAARG